jgi:hypothetical protein
VFPQTFQVFKTWKVYNHNLRSMPTTSTLTLTTVTFPEIRLPQRAAAQLRGFFGTYFREHSPLLHNHLEDGRTRYAYPLVQYKVVGGVPMLVGLQEGAQLLAELFFKISTLRVEGREYPVLERDIAFRQTSIGVDEQLHDYRFDTLWMPLNQQNYAAYTAMPPEGHQGFLGRILVGNILSFFKGTGLYLPEGLRVMATMRPQEERRTGFKNQLMTSFRGNFTTNALLPDHIGLGKSVARGYGTISKV